MQQQEVLLRTVRIHDKCPSGCARTSAQMMHEGKLHAAFYTHWARTWVASMRTQCPSSSRGNSRRAAKSGQKPGGCSGVRSAAGQGPGSRPGSRGNSARRAYARGPFAAARPKRPAPAAGSYAALLLAPKSSKYGRVVTCMHSNACHGIECTCGLLSSAMEGLLTHHRLSVLARPQCP